MEKKIRKIQGKGLGSTKYKMINIHMKNTKTLINFFKNDYDILGRDLNFCMNHLSENERGFCQCFSEKFIEKSSDSKLMRSFMLCSTFFDQFFYTHYRSIYTEFSNVFNFPKIYAHGMGGHASPSWFVYKFHGYDKKADWKNIKDILEIISKDIMDWFKIKHSDEEVLFLKETMKKEVKQEFEEYPDSVLLIHILEKHIN